MDRLIIYAARVGHDQLQVVAGVGHMEVDQQPTLLRNQVRVTPPIRASVYASFRANIAGHIAGGR